MQPISETTKSYDQMLIVEKYERVISYLYPIAQSVPAKHGIAKKMFLECLLEQPGLFINAGKSLQISKIYSADAGLANVRFWLRFLHSIKCLTSHQLETSQIMLAEVGSLIGAWIKNKQKTGQVGQKQLS